ncbi:MAG: VWA domain-containing protein [Candidatus Gracilibacteria bacterium]|nr:VWA domain-containing protein [Candidatus Gracilibacteria bacterium]
MYFTDIEFLNKSYFLLLILLPFLAYFFYKKQSRGFDFIFFKDLKSTFKNNNYSFYLKNILLVLIIINFVLILANPNKTNVSEKIEKNGIDIVIALDISGSMEADDLSPNRIEAAKGVISKFIKKLQTDRLGLVVFAGKPFTSIPLTFDYNILDETITNLGTNNIDQQQRGLGGTAVGDAILMAKTLFKAPKGIEEKDYENREKVIILLTDGDANVGVEPTLAGLSAKEIGIKIYTIGIGSKEGGYITYNNGPFKQQQKVAPLNEKTLRQIASDTNGEFFRADNNNTFESIFQELSKLQKNDINIEIKKQYSEYYTYFLYSLVILLGLFTYLMVCKVEYKTSPYPSPTGEGIKGKYVIV